MVKNYTLDQIIKRVESLSTFKGWKKGFYLTTVRSDEDTYNKFDDKGYLLEVVNDGEKPKFHFVAPITTNSGAEGLMKFATYNKLGCAILKGDYMVYDSHTVGLHKGKYTAFRQSKGFPYYRDADRDTKAEELGKEYTDVIYANIHKAGSNSNTIDNWSLACIVYKVEADFNKLMTIATKGKSITLCILKEW